MGLELLTPPASEPVSLDEAKAHLRVDHNDEDGLIARLIGAARGICERQTGRAFLTQQWRLWRDCWPKPRMLDLPRPPLIAVAAVTMHDRSGEESPLSSDAYIVDTASVPGRIVLKSGAFLPAILADANGLSVTYSSGY